MVRSSSLFSQVLALINRHEFARHVRDLKADRRSKGFTCWDQFVAMLFCQLTGSQSLREISNGLRCCLGKLNHLGLRSAPCRSTLSYANAKRPWELYEAVFYDLLDTCQSVAPRKKFRFRNKLLSLDSSVIELCVTMFDWAKFKQTKGAVKLHMLLDHDGYLPCFATVTDGKTADVRIAKTLDLPPDSIIAMDRGYLDYAMYGEWTERGVWFVTRLRSDATYEVVEQWEVPQGRKILKDETIRLTSRKGVKGCPHDLRIVEVWDDEKQESYVLLTNHLTFGATTIAAIYKDR